MWLVATTLDRKDQEDWSGFLTEADWYETKENLFLFLRELRNECNFVEVSPENLKEMWEVLEESYRTWIWVKFN